jgi:2-polyprenyl-3-methyl-5-hydroxy-6-metoxy-1,4-benzoquinol methylase
MAAHFCPLCNSNNIHLIKNWTNEEIQSNYDLYQIQVNDILPDITPEYKCMDCKLIFFNAEEGTEVFYQRLSVKDWYYPCDKEEFKITSKFITNEDSVLEIGAGIGQYLNHIQPKYYQGLEFNSSAVEQAQNNNINVINEDLAKHTGLYSVVIAHQVLEHVKDPNNFIQNCLNCLESGGKLILSVPSQDGWLSLLPNWCLNQPPHHLTKWMDQTLAKIAKIFKLKLCKLIHDTEFNPHHRELLGYDYVGSGHTVIVVFEKK